MRQTLLAALGEVEAAVMAVDAGTLENICKAIAEARSVVLFGCGREGLQLRGFAMRLYHLGREVSYAGEMNTPPLGAGDLLIVSAGPGHLATVEALARIARNAGAKIVLFTGTGKGEITNLADFVVTVPAQTMATDEPGPGTTVLPMGSAYEGALFFLFEAMVDRLKAITGETAETMRSRHTNLE